MKTFSEPVALPPSNPRIQQAKSETAGHGETRLEANWIVLGRNRKYAYPRRFGALLSSFF